MGLYGKNKATADPNSPFRTGSGARKTPTLTGRKPSSKSESDALNVSSSKPLPSLISKHRQKDNCPCNESLGSWKIDCSKCGQFWHVDCVGLQGLNEKSINSLTQYLCPLCYVSPVPTTETTVDVCHICRNTLSLQHANLAYESSIASENIGQFCSLLGSLDMKALTKNMDTLSQFDCRLKHLLLKENSLVGLDSEIRTLSNLLADHKTATSNNESLAKCISELQEDIKILQLPSPTPTCNDSSDRFLIDISEKLDRICREEADITTGLERLRESLEAAQSNHIPQPARPTNAPSHHLHAAPSFPVHPTRLSPSTEPETPPVPHNQVPVSDTKPEFLEHTEAEELKAFLDSTTFNQENGHSVISFGTPYQYNGSKSSSEVPPFPDCLKPLLARINTIQAELYGSLYSGQSHLTAPVINSCLINRYVGPDSYLPRHSDSEPSIHPESSIFTISLGQSSDIKFTERLSGTESSHTCSDRSLYIMSRRSQEIFDHEMEKGSISEGTRYSLTFRCVGWANKNSTCLIGDSNTRFLKFGSNKRGTFGEQMPGQKFWAPKIEEIDPVSCMGYSNVVLLCGINNIKQTNIRCEKDVTDCFVVLKQKIKQIQMLSPSVKAVYVCPLLPTKDLTLNRKVNDFNKLICFDLIPTCKDVVCVGGFDQFACNRVLAGELSMLFDRYGRFDMLHLNRAGARVLAGLIKHSVFLRLHNGVDKRRRTGRVDGRLYSNVVRSRSHHSGLVDGCQV